MTPKNDARRADTPIEPDGNALSRPPDAAEGGADSSPHETVPDGEKAEAARQAQQAEKQ